MRVRMKTIVALISALSLLSGCMTIELSGNAPLSEDSKSESETIHGSIYQHRWSQYHVQKCHRGTIAKVEFQTNALMLLASFASLGLYVPQTVEWWCADTEEDRDDDELSPDPKDESGSWSKRETGVIAG